MKTQKDLSTHDAKSASPHNTNWIREHYDDDVHPPKKEWPAAQAANVSSNNPLGFDLFWSMRSPYCYLVLDRILWLHSNFNVKINFRPILPIAVRTPEFFDRDKLPWYRWEYDMVDQHRIAKFHGIPFRRPNPEPVEQDTYPPATASLAIAKDQPLMWHLTRLAAASQEQKVGAEFLNQVSHLMWDGSTNNWPKHLVECMDRAGMGGAATDADVKANPAKYDAIIDANQSAHHATGHGGVPNMAFRGEPFFGQDRFDLFFYRLVENGLTQRSERFPPLVPRPRNLPRFAP